MSFFRNLFKRMPGESEITARSAVQFGPNVEQTLRAEFALMKLAERDDYVVKVIVDPKDEKQEAVVIGTVAPWGNGIVIDEKTVGLLKEKYGLTNDAISLGLVGLVNDLTK